MKPINTTNVNYKMDKIHLLKILRLTGVTILAFMVMAGSCQPIGTTERMSIQKGKFLASVTETGELEAVNAYTIITPSATRFGRLLLVDIIEHGKEVKKGDLIVRIDPANIMSYIVEQETRLEVETASMNKMQAQHASRIKNLETQLKTTQADYDMKKLEVEKFQFESDKKKNIKKLEFEQAEIRLKDVTERMKLEKNIIQNENRIQQIKIRQRKENISDAYETKKELDLYSEINGIAQVRNHWRTDQMLKQGDQVWQGMPLVSIPDVSKMKVLSIISESDIAKIKLGQKVVVRLDAYPERPFEGKIVEIGRLSHPKNNKSDVKVFDVVITIIESDEALKPGMTVSCEYIYADETETFFVPNECLEKNHTGYYLYKETLTGYEQQKVNIGARNNKHTVILGTFKEGTKLIPVSEIQEKQENNS